MSKHTPGPYNAAVIFKPGVMGSCLRPVQALGQMCWAPATLKAPARNCYLCHKIIHVGATAYGPMAGGDKGRRLHIRCVLRCEKREAAYRVALAKAEGKVTP